MTKPKVVVFDLGKVLLDFDYHVAARRFASACRKTPEEIIDFLLHTPILLQFETGALSRQSFYEQFCKGMSFQGGPREFADIFGNIFKPIEPMVQLHADLRARSVRTCVFSNTNDLAIEYIRKAFPWFSDFDAHVLSYEHRCMKPDPVAYDVVERAMACRGAGILYIDDRAENIVAGETRGWQTILHDKPEETREQVRQLGLI